MKDWDEHLPLVLRFCISQCPTPKMNINPRSGTGRGSLNTNFLSTLLFIKKNPALHHEEFAEWMWRTSFPAVQLWGYSINSKMLKIISQTPSQFWIYGTIIFANIFIFNFPIFHPIFHLPLLLAPTSVCSQVRCRRWRVQRHHHGLEGTIQAALQCLSVALNELHCWGLPSKKCKENVFEKYLDGKVQFF